MKRKFCIVCEETDAMDYARTCRKCFTNNYKLQYLIENNPAALKLYKKTPRARTSKQYDQERVEMIATKMRRSENVTKTYTYHKIMSLLEDRQPWSLNYLFDLLVGDSMFTIQEATPIFSYFFNQFYSHMNGLAFQLAIGAYILDPHNFNTIDCLHPVVQETRYIGTGFYTRPRPVGHVINIWRNQISRDTGMLLYPDTVQKMYRYAISALWIEWRIRRMELGYYCVPIQIIRNICAYLDVKDWAKDNFEVIKNFNW